MNIQTIVSLLYRIKPLLKIRRSNYRKLWRMMLNLKEWESLMWVNITNVLSVDFLVMTGID